MKKYKLKNGTMYKGLHKPKNALLECINVLPNGNRVIFSGVILLDGLITWKNLETEEITTEKIPQYYASLYNNKSFFCGF